MQADEAEKHNQDGLNTGKQRNLCAMRMRSSVVVLCAWSPWKLEVQVPCALRSLQPERREAFGGLRAPIFLWGKGELTREITAHCKKYFFAHLTSI